jgi:hypothetical protein
MSPNLSTTLLGIRLGTAARVSMPPPSPATNRSGLRSSTTTADPATRERYAPREKVKRTARAATRNPARYKARCRHDLLIRASASIGTP